MTGLWNESTTARSRGERDRAVNPLYKSKLCKNWLANGSCPYNEKCQFAHGTAERNEYVSKSRTIGTSENATPGMEPVPRKKRPTRRGARGSGKSKLKAQIKEQLRREAEAEAQALAQQQRVHQSFEGYPSSSSVASYSSSSIYSEASPLRRTSTYGSLLGMEDSILSRNDSFHSQQTCCKHCACGRSNNNGNGVNPPKPTSHPEEEFDWSMPSIPAFASSASSSSSSSSGSTYSCSSATSTFSPQPASPVAHGDTGTIFAFMEREQKLQQLENSMVTQQDVNPLSELDRLCASLEALNSRPSKSSSSASSNSIWSSLDNGFAEEDPQPFSASLGLHFTSPSY